jgi:hypothetical protein
LADKQEATEVKKLIKQTRTNAPGLNGENPVAALVGTPDTIIPGSSGQTQQQLPEYRDALATFARQPLREILEWMDRCDGRYTGHYHQQSQAGDEDAEGCRCG